MYSILGFNKSDRSTYALLRKIRGKIVSRSRRGSMSVIANGRKDWIGWVELRTEPVDEIAVLNTGRVIKDVAADILAVIEAENRVSLEMFSEIILKKVRRRQYKEVMLIDGNDRRGIDVGVMTKNDFTIKSITLMNHSEMMVMKMSSF